MTVILPLILLIAFVTGMIMYAADRIANDNDEKGTKRRTKKRNNKKKTQESKQEKDIRRLALETEANAIIQQYDKAYYRLKYKFQYLKGMNFSKAIIKSKDELRELQDLIEKENSLYDEAMKLKARYPDAFQRYSLNFKRLTGIAYYEAILKGRNKMQNLQLKIVEENRKISEEQRKRKEYEKKRIQEQKRLEPLKKEAEDIMTIYTNGTEAYLRDLGNLQEEELYKTIIANKKQIITIDREIRREQLLREREEEKRQEEVQRKLEEKKREEERRQEVEKRNQDAIRKTNIMNTLKQGVAKWNCTDFALPVYYMYYYYPTTCTGVYIDDHKQNVRQIVWGFKQGNHLSTKYRLQKVLNHFFPKEALNNLTLVCVPASNANGNNCRFKKFAEEVCAMTGMNNAFNHIKVIADRKAAHDGGSDGDLSNISFDPHFFYGLTVIIFDDIITKGNSMRVMQQQLESMGANVIGGIALGRTVHHDCGQNPIDEL